MLPEALIITSRCTSSESALARVLNEVVHCHWQTWETLRLPEFGPRCHAQCIVAHLEQVTDRAYAFLRYVRHNPLLTPLLVLLPDSCDKETAALVSEVAADFLFWPGRELELKLRTDRILGAQSTELEQVKDALRTNLGLTQLVGNHPAFLRAVHQVLLFRNSDAPVLITGETGTGKELFAHAIHSLSPRRNGPFIPLDCGTLPEHLAENELFGHRRGAYTDAHADQKGLAGMADGGTLFLDEIDALSPANQSKLLRFLQEGTYRALGSDRIARSNVRIFAATNRPIEEAVRERQFRNDLYFRINVLRLELPPLRQRRSDISVLARHFLQSESSGAETRMLSPLALRKLEQYHWPGNVRELLNTIQRAIVFCADGRILPEHIVLAAAPMQERPETEGSTLRSAKRSLIEKFERDYIEELLIRFQGNVTRAAHEAGKERRSFGRLIKKYGIDVPIPHQNLPGHKPGRS